MEARSCHTHWKVHAAQRMLQVEHARSQIYTKSSSKQNNNFVSATSVNVLSIILQTYLAEGCVHCDQIKAAGSYVVNLSARRIEIHANILIALQSSCPENQVCSPINKHIHCIYKIDNRPCPQISSRDRPKCTAVSPKMIFLGLRISSNSA
jgi:hypothetical protein